MVGSTSLLVTAEASGNTAIFTSPAVQSGDQLVTNITRLLDGSLTIAQWIDNNLNAIKPPLLPLTVQSDGRVVARFVAAIEDMSWTLEQAILERTLRFEDVVSRFYQSTTAFHQSLLDGEVGDSLKQLEQQIGKASDLIAQTCSKIMVGKVGELQRRRSRLIVLIAAIKDEKDWLELCDKMSTQLAAVDLDGAQSTLEELDRRYLVMSEESDKRALLRLDTKLDRLQKLRNSLIDLIRAS